MKCAACGYERIVKGVFTPDVIYYKSGKRKGEVKEIKSKEIILEVGTEDFKKLYFKKDVDTLVYKEDLWSESEVILFACPECGTVKIGDRYD